MVAHTVDDPTNEIDLLYSEKFEKQGIQRRDFIKFCTAIAAAMAMPSAFAAEVAKTITNNRRPAVIWLHFQECTGCTESLLRATHPTVETLVLDLISLDYSETLSVASGHQVEAALHQSIKENKGKFILVVEEC